MATFNVACLNQNNYKTDPETGCRYCVFGRKIEYESCRQSFYLRKQSDIKQQDLKQNSALTDQEQKIQNLESSNVDLQKIIYQQNQHITQLIENSKQSTKKIEIFSSINTALIVTVILISTTFLVVKFLRVRKK